MKSPKPSLNLVRTAMGQASIEIERKELAVARLCLRVADNELKALIDEKEVVAEANAELKVAS